MSPNEKCADADVARAERNRRNAQHSTGPRTPEGRACSAQNATKHGLYAKSLVIRGEDPDALHALRETRTGSTRRPRARNTRVAPGL